MSEKGGTENVRISALRFVLAESCDAVIVGVDSAEGGKVRMWELEFTQQTCHKLFNQSSTTQKPKLVPTWKYCSEFGGGGSKLVNITTPISSIMGGDKPSCYVCVGFADGSIQCLIRDSLQQISSVELPRGGNLPLDNSKVMPCKINFKNISTSNFLLINYRNL